MSVFKIKSTDHPNQPFVTHHWPIGQCRPPSRACILDTNKLSTDTEIQIRKHSIQFRQLSRVAARNHHRILVTDFFHLRRSSSYLLGAARGKISSTQGPDIRNGLLLCLSLQFCELTPRWDAQGVCYGGSFLLVVILLLLSNFQVFDQGYMFCKSRSLHPQG